MKAKNLLALILLFFFSSANSQNTINPRISNPQHYKIEAFGLKVGSATVTFNDEYISARAKTNFLGSLIKNVDLEIKITNGLYTFNGKKQKLFEGTQDLLTAYFSFLFDINIDSVLDKTEYNLTLENEQKKFYVTDLGVRIYKNENYRVFHVTSEGKRGIDMDGVKSLLLYVKDGEPKRVVAETIGPDLEGILEEPEN